MKVNELMIGDWYSWEAEGKKYYYQVTKETFSSPDYDIYNFQPIPITAEILEKNGFHVNGMPNSIASVKGIDDWSDDTYVWSRQETPDERMFVSVYMDDPANFFVEVYCQYCHADGIHVKYLHELQHTLRLCCIYKEIVL